MLTRTHLKPAALIAALALTTGPALAVNQLPHIPSLWPESSMFDTSAQTATLGSKGSITPPAQTPQDR